MVSASTPRPVGLTPTYLSERTPLSLSPSLTLLSLPLSQLTLPSLPSLPSVQLVTPAQTRPKQTKSNIPNFIYTAAFLHKQPCSSNHISCLSSLTLSLSPSPSPSHLAHDFDHRAGLDFYGGVELPHSRLHLVGMHTENVLSNKTMPPQRAPLIPQYLQVPSSRKIRKLTFGQDIEWGSALAP